MKKPLFAFAAIGEALTGLLLLLYPPIVIKLLFGAEVAGIDIVMARFLGITLLALGIVCWPCATASRLCGMLTYSTLAMLYLLYVGIGANSVGILLWPAIALHAVLTVLLAWSWLKATKERITLTSPHSRKTILKL